MASLNPNAPVYIPSPHLLSLESYYSPPPPPPPQHPSPSPSSYFQYNQTPYQNNAIYTSSPSPYVHDLCYYLSPQISFVCCYRKGFSYFQIPQPCPPRPLPHPAPLPPSCLKQPRGSLSPLIEEGEGKDKPQDHVVSAAQVKQEVEKKVVRKKASKGANGSKGFRVFASGSFTGKRVYVPKPPRCQGRLPPLLRRTKLTGDFEFKKVEPGPGDSKSDAKTTVMIKNLPNKFTTEKLMDILDKHCLRENEKVLSLKGEEKACDGVVKLADGEGATTLSEFDFLYLPIDFRSGSNLGYAFVNFTSSTAAWKLHDYLHHFEWKCFGSRKICEVTYARIQGLRELKNHFTSSVFLCNRDQYLPLCFQPSRNGFNQPEPECVGRRIHVASEVTK
ncbi:protein terminal ear1-like [Phoenix dactylifera]|uniref:Protein terminal ear1-like n=1 Tax=Phoenix dactylifera TaxID=42345 RepID=A0A8B7D3B6_PHODC|nr:protein terminal ear1-like [Phoenix dactylifera]